MIIEQLKEKKDFTESEKFVADYILENMEDLLELSAEELAKKAYTSKATILRLCRKLNMPGYQDFKMKIELELMELYRMSCILSDEPVNENTSYKDMVNIIPAIYETAVSNTRLSLDHNVIRRVIERLKHTDKIEIYGGGISYTVARAAAFKFMTLGIESVAYHGINEHYIMASSNPKRTVLLITFTGANPSILQIARYLKKNDIYVVGIGGSDNKEFRKYCNEFIEIYTKKLIMSMEVLTAFTSTNYIMDLFFVALLIADYKHNLDASLKVWDYERDI